MWLINVCSVRDDERHVGLHLVLCALLFDNLFVITINLCVLIQNLKKSLIYLYYDDLSSPSMQGNNISINKIERHIQIIAHHMPRNE